MKDKNIEIKKIIHLTVAPRFVIMSLPSLTDKQIAESFNGATRKQVIAYAKKLQKENKVFRNSECNHYDKRGICLGHKV
jgi:hypothetical protein